MSKDTTTLNYTSTVARMGDQLHINIPKNLHVDVEDFKEQKLDITLILKKRRN